MIAKSRCAAAAVLAAFMCPIGAYAGVVSVNGESVTFVAGSGETNHLHVLYTLDSVTMTDTGTPIAAGPGCTSLSPEEAVCLVATLRIHVALGDLGDSLSSTWARELFFGSGRPPPFPPGREARFDGGAGDDTLESATVDLGGHAEFLNGGPGNDVLIDGAGATHTYYDGGPGADVFEGIGTLTYADRLNPITVTTDGLANDGESGEGDQVPSTLWRVVGGTAGDTIVGGYLIDGGPGDDTLTGGPERSRPRAGSASQSGRLAPPAW